jgi:TonB family protein
MARPLVGSGAFVTSVVAHGLLLSLGAVLLSHSLRDHAALTARVAPSVREVELELPSFDPAASERSGESEVAPAPVPPAGGGPRERHPDTERAGRGGSRTAPQAATNLESHIDPISLETDPLSHLDRSQVQRLRTAAERRSWDDHRSTPTPLELTFLATGKGRVRERRAAGDDARGSVVGTLSAALGGMPGGGGGDGEAGLPSDATRAAALPGGPESELQHGATSAAERPVPSRGAQVLLARPWVMRARPAIPTEVRERPKDSDDSSQAVSARVAALIHASTIGAPEGPGVGGEPTGRQPGRSGTEGLGSRTVASGFGPGPDALNDPGIQGFVAALKQRVDAQLHRAFPDWAIAEGRSGHIIFELAVLADGRLERVRMLRASGIAEYDGNVMTGVRQIPGFGPLPKALGQRALITMSYDSLNHVIGREGPGPGGYGAIQQGVR